ncbi:hypothetical protein QE109_11215 [Fusibacter bizertensis]|uniref:ABC transmembrane type-1 domain-containing protein n=1 Tax=Fusibacter bizertensis TaxID=1488331 RepID=A0ABT6NE92_9FIRM|nr:hypothetical protein [Fusibacter bizertensis]MDH8678722.1 hypothetical protein [Fusibacter bizertensis]
MIINEFKKNLKIFNEVEASMITKKQYEDTKKWNEEVAVKSYRRKKVSIDKIINFTVIDGITYIGGVAVFFGGIYFWINYDSVLLVVISFLFFASIYRVINNKEILANFIKSIEKQIVENDPNEIKKRKIGNDEINEWIDY